MQRIQPWPKGLARRHNRCKFLMCVQLAVPWFVGCVRGLAWTLIELKLVRKSTQVDHNSSVYA